MSSTGAGSPFRLNGSFARALPPAVAPVLEPLVEHLLALRQLERTYARLPRDAAPAEFARHALELFGPRCELPPRQQARIPGTGAAMVIANHPFGGLEGVFMISLLGALRADARILGNHVLARIPELAPLVIPVDPFGGAGASRRNLRGMRLALRHLQQGGLLLVFPAGAVAHLRPAAGGVTDPPWHPSVARLARLTGAPVIPVWFDGANSAAFQLAGLVHPRLRTALLPRELMNKQRRRIKVHIGDAILAGSAVRRGDDADVTRQLRLCTYALALGESLPAVQSATSPPAPIAAAVPAARVRVEVEALPATQALLRHGDLCVYHASAAQAPWLLQELGRLREQTFRAAGEGTGRAADIDLYDDYYEHLFVWHAVAGDVVGAYRIGHADRICRSFGKRGLYTHSLFDFREPLLPLLGPSLELGRSFIRRQYQRGFAPLLLLWKGIATYVARRPQYRTLFGPVSISDTYSHAAKQLLVAYLRLRHGQSLYSRLVRARRPFADDPALNALRAEVLALPGIEALDRVVAGLESDGKGVPVLIRQYLNLGGRILSFNVDHAFGDAIDCLVAVDLRRTDVRILGKFMGQDAASTYLAAQGMRRRAL